MFDVGIPFTITKLWSSPQVMFKVEDKCVFLVTTQADSQVPCSMGPSAFKAALKSKSIKIGRSSVAVRWGVDHADDQMKDKRHWITMEVKGKSPEMVKSVSLGGFHQIPPSKALEALWSPGASCPWIGSRCLIGVSDPH